MIRQRWATFVKKHPIGARGVRLTMYLAVSVLIIDLLAYYGFGLRRFGYGSERFFQYSSVLGWEHPPFAEGTWYAYKDGTRTHVSINAYGFPDRDWPVAKAHTRIALMGDTTSEFWEVAENQRAQFVMENLLNGGVEVLNFGLRAASTDQELVRYRTQVIHFSPDIAVLFFCVNDIHENAVTGSKPYFVLDETAAGGIRLEGIPVRSPRPATATFSPLDLLEKSFVLRQIKYWTVGTGTFLRVDGPLERQFELRPYKRAYDADDQRWFELERRLLAAFASFSREHDIRFLLVEGLYRPALDEGMQRQVIDAYGDQFDFDKVSRLLEEHSAVAGYEFVSLPRLVRARHLDVLQLMHPDDTMHLNAAGVKLFAEAVTEKIRSLGWLRDAHYSTPPSPAEPVSHDH